MDAISGVVVLTVAALAALTALGLFGPPAHRLRPILAVTLIVHFIGLAIVMAIAQQINLAAGSLVAGLIIVGLLIFGSADERRRADDQGRDDWGR